MKRYALISSSLFMQQFIQVSMLDEPFTCFSESDSINLNDFDRFIYAPMSTQSKRQFPVKKTLFIGVSSENTHYEYVVKSDLTSSAQFKQDLVSQWHQLSKVTDRDSFSSSEIVAIGSSAGGPESLKKVLSCLPADFPAPIVVAQHMPAQFTKKLAKRLNEDCLIRVKEGLANERLSAGTVYIAPGGKQMEVACDREGAYLHISDPEQGDVYHPSVSRLFQSISFFKKKTVVVLTGMGTDGADTLAKLSQSGECRILAEKKESAVIFGMPRAAIKTGFVDESLLNDEIGEWLARMGAQNDGST
ncbi:two-component system chemotaxis response regulator CheB [Alkalihalobacillus xiaoxiensis]|uniref:protein-glutamate methylesterase n=1 Tax=Shouchella xiaoxiensis TaxID=766895 RepID=A0ABS2ST45_9BACI|nr:two-component system chemotaxis response regulator CheB [Shouchella xiaoxiensis]